MRPTQHPASRESRGKRQEGDTMKTATIFMNVAAWRANNPRFVGVRFDTQALPVGSAVVGFVTPDGVAIDVPAGMTPEMAQSWNLALDYVDAILCGKSTEEPENIL